MVIRLVLNTLSSSNSNRADGVVFYTGRPSSHHYLIIYGTIGRNDVTQVAPVVLIGENEVPAPLRSSTARTDTFDAQQLKHQMRRRQSERHWPHY
jgi:hypothetical protein